MIMIPTDRSDVIPMQLVRIEVQQRPDVPQEKLLGGAFFNCYLKDRSAEQAYEYAKAWIEDNGWDIVKLEEQREIDRTSFMKPEDGLKYYQQALAKGEAFVLHAYPQEKPGSDD